MARYTGPVCRLCRREGVKLFLKGTKCSTDKCAVAKRAFPPGQHGKSRKKVSNYMLQLREKQKIKRIYGMLERQFKHYFRIAQESKGVTGLMLLELLERRLDNVIFRMSFSHSRSHARQIVRHGLTYVNGRRVNIPSYTVKVGDEVTIKAGQETLKRYREIHDSLKDRVPPKWMTIEPDRFASKIVALPTKEDVGFPVEEQMIVELYSK